LIANIPHWLRFGAKDRFVIVSRVEKASRASIWGTRGRGLSNGIRCFDSASHSRSCVDMPFQLPELPFANDALAPVMSAETLEFHHGKHHKAYVTKTNELVEGDDSLAGASLLQLVKRAKESGNQKLFNNSAQLWNHSFFWQCLAPSQGQKPDGKLVKLIEDAFGSPQALLDKLQEEAVNHFSNGWAWLVLDRGSLRVTSLHDADTPIVHEGMVPLFTLDVWEHAYYIDYRNERPRFASSVLANIVNWDFVAQNLDGKGFERANQGEGARSPELTA
jgi:superoxide dismutase, Fe-Mn family